MPFRADFYMRRASLLAIGLTVFTSIVLAGCETPAAPEWDVGVILPISTDPISVADFLPAAVGVDTAAGVPVFTVDPQSDLESYTLGQLCGAACVALNGQTTQVPGFTYYDTIDVALDADIVELEITSATLAIELSNGLSFDPLRPDPDPANAGRVELTISDFAGTPVTTVTLRGDTMSMPANTTVTINAGLNGIVLREGLRAAVEVYSPADGQTTTIDTSDQAGFTATLDQLNVSAVKAVVDNRSLDEDFRLDVDADLRDEIGDRVQSGSITVTLTHDVEIDGTLDISIAASPTDLYSGDPAREVRISNLDFSFAPSGREIERTLTLDEIDFIATRPDLFVGYRGSAAGSTMDAGRPTARVTPDQAIESQVKLSTQVRVGG